MKDTSWANSRTAFSAAEDGAEDDVVGIFEPVVFEFADVDLCGVRVGMSQRLRDDIQLNVAAIGQWCPGVADYVAGEIHIQTSQTAQFFQ